MHQIITQLKIISADAQLVFGKLSAEQINWKPDSESWSIGQCFDHLIKSNEAFEPLFEKFKTAQHKHSFWEKYSPLTGFFGNFLLNYLNNDAKKIKAPSEKIVPPSEIAPEIISQFIAHQSKIIKTIESLENTDLTKSVITSPFAKIMTYRLDKTFEIAVAHEKRHIRQAERVLKMQRS